MDNPKTTVLPQGQPAEARRIFHERVRDPQGSVSFVVLGTGPAAESLAAKASKLAGDDMDLRWVIWAPSQDDVIDEIRALSAAAPTFIPTIEGRLAAGFTTSVAPQIRDVIRTGELADSVRVEQSYLKAEEA